MKLFRVQHIKISGLPNLFELLDWEVQKNESWVVYGPSGSGKSLLKDLLLKKHPLFEHGPKHKGVSPDTIIAECSPQKERELLERERHDDDSEFIEGGYDPGRSAIEIISELKHPDFKELETWIEHLELSKHLQSSFKTLSNGETRKVLFLRALAQKPDLLLCDSPFEGLDHQSRDHLKKAFESGSIQGCQILFVQRLEDIPPGFKHVLVLKQNHPPETHTLESLNKKTSKSQNFSIPEDIQNISQLNKSNPLIEIRDLNIRYGEKVIFKNFNWTMHSNENWLFTGPNGAGKTTLLQLINADHPQSYGQNMRLFGYQRGQGESIWDIKAHIGFVSADFQRNYPLSMTGMSLVVSGFFDSVGVYKKPTDHQLHLAHIWMQCLKIEDLSSKYLRHMSWGEIRTLMIARALVKKPNLLILDEPCQGLDDQQKPRVLDLIENCSHSFDIQMIFVAHHADEQLNSMTHQLEWLKTDSDVYQHRFHQLSS